MSWVFIFSIGPVQGLIAAARRGGDLWFGSHLLSELSRAAARQVRRGLIFPTPDLLNQPEQSIGNKIMALIDEAPGPLAERMEAAVQRHLMALFDEHLRGLAGCDLVTAEAQLRELPEVAWAAAEVRPDRPYAEARAHAEAALAAHKAARPFHPPPGASHARKSHLDGERESVLNQRFPRAAHGVKAKEHLSGVDLLKRVAGRAQRVPSLSHVAATATLRALADAPEALQVDYRAAAQRYRDTLRALGAEGNRTPRPHPVLGDADAHALYPSRLHDLFPSLQPTDPAIASAQEALSALRRAWRQAAEAHGNPPPPRPQPYYAVLRADGDRMGAKLNAMRSPQQHQAVSQALARFTAQARELVEAHHGHCLYAGGDDVLALLGVTEALPCAEALQGAFCEALAPEIEAPSMSVGLCVAHHIHPWRVALKGSHHAEHLAKEAAGRGAWAVVVQKRGGSPVEAHGKWADLPSLSGLLSALRTSGELGRSLPYTLEQVTRGLQEAPLRAAERRRVMAQRGVPTGLSETLTALEDRAPSWLLVARSLSGMEER